ncbi:hypothetical protein [Pedobacter hartonius]|uniref:Site-specific DNA recombinase n=1 Tax=Pedobacter hartonius TaxID=425514 RepID=A0A1H4CE91_9SPHI|nr:hypothetical protein [Pedobacter hartonius]SEA58382.1 hypothetical protein SAMN05443550_1046 [Pedobacter hartonius]
MAALFKEIVNDATRDSTAHVQLERKKCITEITTQNNRITKARELLLMDHIEGEEYKILKKESEKKIIRLEAKLKDLTTENSVDTEIHSILDKALYSLINLTQLYRNADVEGKRVIIGSIFPEKWSLTALYIEPPKSMKQPLLSTS